MPRWHPLWLRYIWGYLVFDTHLSLLPGFIKDSRYPSGSRITLGSRDTTLDSNLDILPSSSQSEVSQRIRTHPSYSWMGLCLHTVAAGHTHDPCRVSKRYRQDWSATTDRCTTLASGCIHDTTDISMDAAAFDPCGCSIVVQ